VGGGTRRDRGGGGIKTDGVFFLALRIKKPSDNKV